MPIETKRARPPEQVETIVVGTGFGGSVTACRLAQAGFQVLVLERGRRYERQDFPPLPLDGQLLPDLKRWTWEPDQGIWDIVDLQELLSVQAAGYGGGSLLYANVQLRAPHSVFAEARWPIEYRVQGELEPWYDLVASMLDIAPIDSHPELGGKLVKADQLRRAMKNLGRESAFFHPPLAVSRRRQERHGKTLEKCTGCGRCCSGCPEGAKNTLDYNYLALAEKYGARARTQCEVMDIVQRDDLSWEVRCFDHLLATDRRYQTQNLFLCAGSVHSTRLLSRIRLATRRQQEALHQRVGTGYFPGGDALGVVYGTANAQRPSVGPTITTTTVHWNDESSFFMLQDGGYGSDLERVIGLLRGSEWIGRNQLAGASEKARAGASDGLQAPLPTHFPLKQVPSGSHALPSPVDGALLALRAGDAKGLVSDQLRAIVSLFVKLLELPLLATPAVDRTIDGAMRSKLSGLFGSLFDPEGFVMRNLRRAGRFLIRLLLATDGEFASRALRALLTASGLPPAEVARRVLGYDARGAENRTMLLAMGRDAAISHLIYDWTRDKLVADLDLARLGPGYARQEQLMSDVASELGGELRTSPAWAFLGKPVTVHNQGGCPMSDDARYGVTDPKGRVHGLKGLYVLDGSILSSSVGVNPSHTIAAIAERNIRHIIKNDLPQKASPYEGERLAQFESARHWGTDAALSGWTLRPPVVPARPFQSQQLGLKFSEKMQGYYHPLQGVERLGRRLRDDAVYRRHETLGRPEHYLTLDLAAQIQNLAVYFEDDRHTINLTGTVAMRLPGGARIDDAVEGRLELLVARFKPYGIRRTTRERITAQAFRTTGEKPSPMSRDHVDRLVRDYPSLASSGEVYRALMSFLRSANPADRLDEATQALVSSYVVDLPSGIPTPLTDRDKNEMNRLVSGLVADERGRSLRKKSYRTRIGRPWKRAQRFMRYFLSLKGHPEYRIEGYKRIRDDGGLDAWRDTSTLFVKLLRQDDPNGDPVIAGAGAVHVDLPGFLSRQIPSFEVTGVKEGDPRAAWAMAKFVACFFGDLQRVYSPTASVALDAMLRPVSATPRRWPLRPGL